MALGFANVSDGSSARNAESIAETITTRHGDPGMDGTGSHWDGDNAHPTLSQALKGSGGIAMSDQELFAQRGAGLVCARESGQGYWMEDEVAGTIDANMDLSGHKERPGLVAHVYENHPQDSRITEMDGVCSTVHSKYGTGGGNVPLVAHSLTGNGFDASEDGTGRGTPIVATEWPVEVAPTLNAHFGDKQGLEDQHALNGAGLFVPVAIQGTVIGPADHAGPQGSGHSNDGAMFTLTKADQHAVAIRTAQTSANGHGIAEEVAHTLDGANGQALALPQREGKAGGGKGPLVFEEHSGTLATNNDQTILHQTAVRRLLPVECERLQGFKDGHTNVPYRGKDTSPDGPRYKAIGNSMATNCMEWIGLRIQMAETTPVE